MPIILGCTCAFKHFTLEFREGIVVDQDQGRRPVLKGKGSWPFHGRATSCTVLPGLADLGMANRVEVAETNQWRLFKVEEGIKPINDHWSEATGKTFLC